MSAMIARYENLLTIIDHFDHQWCYLIAHERVEDNTENIALVKSSLIEFLSANFCQDRA